ncbi:uncharacterized protein N7477_009864 [Penicillium maclennaniae]|uniref:uncharacterized protein n=1 Tax=Penicillium maclennaniae TaxID=1343394 RepID=UPI00253FA3DA|nr:uncharacterized protein N7477_009864 [Penicillium maclennaniae]KAJ5662248.1 hypothetical protein N7477_009864 [Penicillium maclennaniae]
MAESASPPRSLPSSPSFHGRSSSRPSLSIDLSNIPALSQPSPPSNTLLITDLNDLFVFQPSSLDAIRAQITVIARLNSFSPLPSFRRIVCSFHSDADAIAVRKHLEGTRLLNRNVRPRIYFGEPTPILSEEELHLPPHGWTMRNEDPPNKEVHASDLATALAKLKTDHVEPAPVDPATPVSISSDNPALSYFNPEDHGHSPNLPAVMVEDVSLPDVEDEDVDMDLDLSPAEMSLKKMPPKTARPPVELME